MAGKQAVEKEEAQSHQQLTVRNLHGSLTASLHHVARSDCKLWGREQKFWSIITLYS